MNTISRITYLKQIFQKKRYMFGVDVLQKNQQQSQKFKLSVKQPKLEDTSERLDSDEVFQQKMEILVKMLKNSKYPILMTGAGISTDSGIPDYRSGADTMLKTGPGKWETDENKEKFLKEKGQPIQRFAINSVPNSNHMTISKLVSENYIKKIITQNVDNLHHKSYIPRQKILELHGNISTEVCNKCTRVFYRDWYTRPKGKPWSRDHFNEKYCMFCDGELHDTLVFFGESLKPDVSKQSFDEINKADFCLIMGTSLVVGSAARLVRQLKENKKPICIVNLQKTKFDEGPEVIKINGLINNVCESFNKQLNLEIQRYIEERNIIFQYTRKGLEEFELEIKSEDWELQPKQFIKSVEIDYVDNQNKAKKIFHQDYNKYSLFFENIDYIKKIKVNFFNLIEEPDFEIEWSAENKVFSAQSTSSFIFLRCNIKLDQDQKQWIEERVQDLYK